MIAFGKAESNKVNFFFHSFRQMVFNLISFVFDSLVETCISFSITMFTDKIKSK